MVAFQAKRREASKAAILFRPVAELRLPNQRPCSVRWLWGEYSRAACCPCLILSWERLPFWMRRPQPQNPGRHGRRSRYNAAHGSPAHGSAFVSCCDSSRPRLAPGPRAVGRRQAATGRHPLHRGRNPRLRCSGGNSADSHPLRARHRPGRRRRFGHAAKGHLPLRRAVRSHLAGPLLRRRSFCRRNSAAVLYLYGCSGVEF